MKEENKGVCLVNSLMPYELYVSLGFLANTSETRKVWKNVFNESFMVSKALYNYRIKFL